MDELIVEASPRTSFGKGVNRRLRAQGMVPAIVYGHHQDPIPVAVPSKDLIRILRSHAGSNTLFGLQIEGAKETENVMIKDYQLEPIEHRLLHADMIRVAMDHVMTVSVHVELQGTPVGVKNEGGMLDFVARTVDVSCLPKDIPETIVADVAPLGLGQFVRARDLKLPENVHLETDPEVVIAHVVVPKKVEVVEEAAAKPEEEEAPAEPEVIRRGKAEEEDSAK